MQHLRTIQGFAVAVIVAAATSSCGRAQAIDEIPPGTEVTLALDTGEVVKGRVVEVRPETVVVERPDTGQPHTIDRAAIASVDSAGATSAGPARSFTERLFSRQPAFDDIDVPAGTVVTAQLETPLSSNTSQAEDIVRATLADPLVVDGREVLPEGTALIGTVTGAEPAGRVKGRATLRFIFDRLTTGTTTYEVTSDPFVYAAESTKAEDAAKIGVGAAAGTIVGALAGGKRGAAVGAAVGGGAGTAVVLATPGDEVRLPSGTTLQVELTRPVTIRLPRRPS
jgi:hypothetical protein